MQYGIARGMYSNEAGEGTAPFAHGCSIVPHPVDEGITGVAEVFLDTIVICSITAFVVGVTDMQHSAIRQRYWHSTLSAPSGNR